MTASKKYQTYSKQGKIFISFFYLIIECVLDEMETERPNMTSPAMICKLTNLLMDIMPKITSPLRFSPVSDVPYTYVKKEKYFFSTISILFLPWQKASGFCLFAIEF